MNLRFISRRNFEISAVAVLIAVFAAINANFEFAILPIFIVSSLLFIKFRAYLYNNVIFINARYDYKLIIRSPADCPSLDCSGAFRG